MVRRCVIQAGTRTAGAERTLYEGMMPLADTRIELAPGSAEILFTRFQAASDDLVAYAKPIEVP